MIPAISCRIPVCCIFYLSIFIVSVAQAQPLSVHFVDVGYADAILISPHPRQACLIDAADHTRAADLAAYMTSMGLSEIPWILITHGHLNHFGGLETIQKSFDVRQIFINPDERADEGYQTMLRSIEGAGVRITEISSGDELDCNGLRLKILHPAKPMDRTAGLNDNAVVSHLKYGKVSMIFWADVGIAVQDKILDEFPMIAEAELVQVPHHGDRLSEKLMTGPRKKIFVASTGPNTWGLPDEKNLEQLNGRIFRSDEQGTIVAETDGKTITIRTAK